MSILLPVIVLGALGAIFGLWLGFVQRLFVVNKDPRTEHVFSLLPGSNCGACGHAGCYGLAEALARGDIDTITCPVVHEREREEISKTLGINTSTENKKIATLICGGGIKCRDNFEYKSIRDCAMAALILNGPKACAFGCIGFGSCVQACMFDAITIDENKLPRIDAEKCTSCGKCTKACPKGVVVMAPADKDYIIACNSKDKGSDVVKACKSGCIACGKCVNICPEHAIKIQENIAVIDYDKCINCAKCIDVCPTRAIIKRKTRQKE